jgi:hypothetical protein
MDSITIKSAGRQGYHVIQGDRIAISLSWGEVMDLVIRLSAPFGDGSPAPFSMLTKQQWRERSRRFRERRREREEIPY